MNNESDPLFQYLDALTVTFILSFLVENVQVQFGGVLVSLLDLLSGLLLSSAIILLFSRPIKMDVVSLFYLPMFIFVLAITSAIAGGRSLAYFGTVMKSMVPYYYIVIYVSVRGHRGFYQVGRWVIITTLIASFYAIFQSAFGIELFGLGRPLTGRWLIDSQFNLFRSAGPFTGYNKYGVFLIFSILFCLSTSYVASGRRIWNALRWTSFIVLSIGALLTQSRSILLAILFPVILWVILSIYIRIDNKWFFISMLLVCSPGILSVLFIGAKEIISISPATVYARFEQNFVALRIFLQNPITGIGLDQFIVVATRYGLYGSDVHNLLFNILSSAGVFGILTFLPFYSNSLRLSLNNLLPRDGRSFIFYTLLGVTFLFQFSPVLASPEFWVIIGVNNGLVTGTNT